MLPLLLIQLSVAAPPAFNPAVAVQTTYMIGPVAPQPVLR